MSSANAPRRIDTSGSGSPPRRRRGAARLSCAECRRLKLRCDRKVPCDSCVKRGCAAICPDGSLTTGKGNRFVLASTQELHEKISELCCRVRELEDALRDSHRRVSEDPHPLLSEELLRIKAPLERETVADKDAHKAAKEEPNADVLDSFGSLSISQSGRSKYYGHIANSWYFLQNESVGEEAEDRVTEVEPLLPANILGLSTAFPPTPASFSPTAEKDRLRSLYMHLPSVNDATRLRDIYYERAAWMYNPISVSQFNEQVFQPVYSIDVDTKSWLNGSDESSAVSHRLALMFMVLAIGTLMDPSLPAFNLEAEKYHQLARAALFQSTMFDSPTLNAVQAVFLMTFYLFWSDRHGTSSGSRWTIMGIAVKLAQSIGLHRDSTRWGITDDDAQHRRATFWELYTYDSWQCLTFGRPPSFTLSHVDCKYPYPNDDPTGEHTFEIWKHKFSSECMSVVHDQAFGSKTPSYQTIIQLDRKLRAFPVPSMLQVVGFGNTELGSRSMNTETPSLPLIMQRHIVLAIREMNLLYMHRGFFARAISDHPKDPLGSPYGTSVLAAYRSAGSLIALMRNLNTQVPEPTTRLWFLWTHLFSCAIVLGSIVTRCPSMSLAPSALVQLDSACELFLSLAPAFRAEKVMNIMKGLQQKAHQAIREWREGRSPSTGPSTYPSYPSPGSPELVEDDELAKLGGKTRLISAKDPSKSPSPTIPTRSPNTLNPVVPLPLPNAGVADVHPNVLEYLQSFVPLNQVNGVNGAPNQEMGYQSGSQQGYQTYGPLSASQYIPGNTYIDTTPNSPSNAYAQMMARQNSLEHVSPSSQRSLSIDEVVDSANSHLPPVTHLQQQSQQQGMMSQQSFPQYFPVFDYGTGGGDMSFSSMSMPMQTTNGHLQHDSSMDYVNGYDMNGHGGYLGSQNRESLSPEATMQSQWHDLVAQYAPGQY